MSAATKATYEPHTITAKLNTGETVYFISSSDGHCYYKVEHAAGHLTCSCPARGPCKHIAYIAAKLTTALKGERESAQIPDDAKWAMLEQIMPERAAELHQNAQAAISLMEDMIAQLKASEVSADLWSDDALERCSNCDGICATIVYDTSTGKPLCSKCYGEMNLIETPAVEQTFADMMTREQPAQTWQAPKRRNRGKEIQCAMCGCWMRSLDAKNRCTSCAQSVRARDAEQQRAATAPKCSLCGGDLQFGLCIEPICGRYGMKPAQRFDGPRTNNVIAESIEQHKREAALLDTDHSFAGSIFKCAR